MKDDRQLWEIEYDIELDTMLGYVRYLEWDADPDRWRIALNLFCGWSGAEIGRVHEWVAVRWRYVVGCLEALLEENGELGDAAKDHVRGKVSELRAWENLIPEVSRLKEV